MLRILSLKYKIALIVLISIIVGAIIISFYPKKNTEESIAPLNASVSFDENRFVITNNDSIDYINAELTINKYYKITGINLNAGETYTIWQVEFAHYNGKRFSQNQKPQQFSIWCDLYNGKKGFYSQGIKY